MRFLVLGSSPAALLTAHKLKAPVILKPLPERSDPFLPGKCLSFFPSPPELTPSLQKAVIYLEKNSLVPYPFQLFFHPLSQRAKMELLRDYINAYHLENSGPRNLREWFLQRFGKSMAELFFIPYNEKLWNYPLEKLSHAWAEDLNPRPTPEEIYFGSQGKRENLREKEFEIFPQREMEDFLRGMVKETVEGGVEEILYRERSIRVSGTTLTYDYLISFIPLRHLLQLLKPEDSIFLLGKELLEESPRAIIKFKATLTLPYHKIYFPLRPLPFIKLFHWDETRVEVPGEEVEEEKTLRILAEAGLVDKFSSPRKIKTSLPLPTLQTYMFRDGIMEKLRQEGIISAGMWGRWEYMGICREILLLDKELSSLVGVES